MVHRPEQKLAITCGDPAGIGPEIVAAWLKQYPDEAKEVAVIGPARWLAALPVRGKQAVIVGATDFIAEPGNPTKAGAAVALDAMKRAAEGCLRGEFSGVVTGPISKEWAAKTQRGFVGQTEFFAKQWQGQPTMAFCGGRLRIALATWHIPLRKVPAHLTARGLARTVMAAIELAQAEGIVFPRVGVCGLNPHAGEGGLLGAEEKTFINPALRRLQKRFPGVSEALPGDTLFGRALKGEFDVVVALYHDQGLAPLKTVDFDEAVNVTLGLPFVRTSPDHGTAFGIAGQGVASLKSFANAITVARRLIAWRANRQNPSTDLTKLS